MLQSKKVHNCNMLTSEDAEKYIQKQFSAF